LVVNLADLRPAPYNPRKITSQALGALQASLGEFGDISGLVWNQRTGHLVAGHQRLAALRKAHGDWLTMADGAVVTPTGERFPVRMVDWPVAREKAANVAANSPFLAGEFDDAELTKVLAELEAALPAEFDALRFDELRWTPPPDADGKEFDETAADDVKYVSCPKCGERFPA